MKTEFAAFILTNGRPDKVRTYTSLRSHGYTGRIFIIVDDLDSRVSDYKKNFGDQVVIFSKKEISKKFDIGDNFNNDKCIIFARMACFEIAKKLKIKYFIQLDDDYTAFRHKYNKKNQYDERRVQKLDEVFERLLFFYKKIPALSIAMAQGGDFIGGDQGAFDGNDLRGLKRKCMNTFICSVDRPFQFMGRINEDVNTYTNLGTRGYIFFTVMNCSIVQVQTQQQAGGMTETYLDSGTYIKSFYSVMYAPSCVKVNLLNSVHKRLHHVVSWDNCTSKIIDEKYRKTK